MAAAQPRMARGRRARQRDAVSPGGAPMQTTFDTFCQSLERSRLVPVEELNGLRQRWLQEATDASNARQFARWLVARQTLTEYQASLLLSGYANHFHLGPYQILDRIGRGRMAGVYKAKHHSGQVVAIKVLPPSQVANPQVMGRFRREARLARRLKHPNVVRTFQRGEADGLHYLVMEHLEGETFDDVLARRGKLPVPEAVRVVYQVLQGLQHIHERDMVHRDLKPANLMLVPGAEAGEPDSTLRSTVKILDIGLGRALFCEDGTGGEEVTQESVLNLTVKGDVLGTPAYQAPEQANDAHSADIRADIYSVGCILYQALTGQLPYPGKTAASQFIGHQMGNYKPVRALTPEVPEGLQAVVDRMLAKDPAQRFATPEQAAAALVPYLARGAEAAPAAPTDPQMNLYLNWLDQNAEDSEADGATPKPSRARKTAPMLPVAEVRRQLQQELVPSGPASNPAMPRSGPASNPSLPRPAPAPVPAPPPVQPLTRPEALLYVALGAGLVLVLEAIGWLVYRWLH